jgi:ABC-type uncharacterized transport system substrate-binding protein
MDRRTFIRAVTAAMIAAPLAASAQTGTTVRRIGYLAVGLSDTPAEAELQAAPLRALGWVEFRNLLIERRYAERSENLGPLAQELVRLKVEIIVAWGTDAVLAAKNATATIPIVIGSAGDPVGSGLAASLARPGGNITGFSIVGKEVDAKRLALLRELLPGLQRVGRLEDSTYPVFRATRTDFEQACRSLGMEPITIEIAAADELENAIAEIARRAQALVAGFGLGSPELPTLMRATLKYQLPTIGPDKAALEAGALAYFGNSDAEFKERNAAFIDRILRGAKPADIPIEQPTKFELGINLKTAKALGITVPQSLLLRADNVIQ